MISKRCFTIFCIVVLSGTHGVWAQQAKEVNVYVKYKQANDDVFYLEQWFSKDLTVYTYSYSYIPKLGSKSAVTTDGKGNVITVDSLEDVETTRLMQKALEEHMNNTKQNLKVRTTGSNIVHCAQYDLNQKKYYVIDTIPPMPAWTILSDTTSIMGYKCQKAFLNYKDVTYVAWFTNSIPVSGGPEHFRGLPGLVLSVWNEKTKYRIDALDVQYPARKAMPDIAMDGKPISQSDFEAIFQRANEDAKQLFEQLQAAKCNNR